MKPILLYIRGAPGTGKITVARILEQRLGWRLFWVHDLDAALRMVTDRPIDAVAVRRMLSDITEPVLRNLFDRRANVIFVRPSGNVEVVHRVQALAEQYGYQFILVSLTASYETLALRVNGRQGWRLSNPAELDGYLRSASWAGMPGEVRVPTDNVTAEEIADKLENLCQPRTVFANGCFDLLHAGHVHMLAEASKQGDRLIVAVNTDASVRRLKGTVRPVWPLTDRMAVLAAIRCVDEAMPFGSEAELTELLQRIRPDVLVKGDDWRGKTITGAEYAGRVHFVPLLPGYSTTAVIARIAGEPAIVQGCR